MNNSIFFGKQRDFLCGYDFGLADILLVSCLDWSTIYQIELPENTTDYLKKIRLRDAYKRAFTINYKNLISDRDFILAKLEKKHADGLRIFRELLWDYFLFQKNYIIT